MTEKIIGDREYTVKTLKEFLNSSWIDDDMPVRLTMSQWNYSKSYPKFYANQVTSFGKPFVKFECKEINQDYNDIWERWRDKNIENTKLRENNKQLAKENKELNSIKRFAERNGINIFNIDEAFHRCWKDNGKLFEENKQLKYASDFMDQLEKLFQKYGFETVNLHVIETLFKEHLKK